MRRGETRVYPERILSYHASGPSNISAQYVGGV